MNYKLKITKAKVLASIKKYVTYISLLFEKVQFSLEDATRTKKIFLLEAIQTAVAAGAKIINSPDTVGYTNLTAYGALFAYLINNLQSSKEIIFLLIAMMIGVWPPPIACRQLKKVRDGLKEP